MFIKPILFKIGGVTASLASVLTFSTPAQSLTFTTFTNEATFRLAAGSLSTETFNSFTADTPFENGVTVNLTDFSLTGFGNRSFGRNNIDVPVLRFRTLNIDGTSIVNGVTDAGTGFNTTFKSPINAFGATFNATSNAGITQLQVGGDIVGSIQFIPEGSVGFYGFIANGSFSTIAFESNNNLGDAFGADNFLYSSSVTPVPFVFSPALGVGALGGLWTAKRLIKKSNKKTK
jgi:hypothetical protein